MFLLPHPRQLFIQLRCAAAGVFYADKGVVQDAHAVGIDGDKHLVIFGIVVKAGRDGLRGVIVAIRRIKLIEFFRQEMVESTFVTC